MERVGQYGSLTEQGYLLVDKAISSYPQVLAPGSVKRPTLFPGLTPAIPFIVS